MTAPFDLRRGTRRVLGKLGLAIGAPLLLLAAAEIAVESFDRVPRPRPPLLLWGWRQDNAILDDELPFRFHPRWFWEPCPGRLYEGEAINAAGYRGPVIPYERSASLRIVALGDSSTMGFGVKDAQSWPRRLEALLRRRGRDVEVVNLGCVGFTAVQGKERFLREGRRYGPDLVVAAFGAINEQFADEQGLSDVERVQRLESWNLRIRMFLDRFTLFRWIQARVGSNAAMPSAEVLHRVRSADGEPVVRVTPEVFGECIEALDHAQRVSGGRLLVVCPPRKESVARDFPRSLRATEATHRVAAARDVPLAEVHDAFRAHESSATGDEWFLDQVHPSVRGHEIYAEIVAAAIERDGLLRRAPPR